MAARPVEVRPGRRLHVFLHEPSSSATQTVFFIHGSMADHLQYQSQLEYLVATAPTTRVVAFDAMGCGESARPASEAAYSTREMMEDLRVLYMKHSVPVESGKNFLVSHSYGTTFALRLASEVGANLAGVVCLAPPWREEDGGPSLFRLPLLLLKCLHPYLSKGFMARALHPETLLERTPHHRALMYRAKERSGKNDMFVAKSFYNQWVFTREAELSRISESTRFLFISGSGDQVTKPEEAKQVMQRLPHPHRVEYHVVGPAGHQVMEEQPDQVNELIERFFRNDSTELKAT